MRGKLGIFASAAALLMVFFMSVAGSGVGKPRPNPNRDGDHDGIPNLWEIDKGPKSLKGLRMKRLGASPRHKDIFVELDFSDSGLRAQLSCATLDSLYDAFAAAPVPNPDGTTGINLHIDAGIKCPSRSYAWGGSSLLSLQPGCVTTSTGFDALGKAAFKSNRFRVFHHFGVVPEFCGGDSGGVAVKPGTTAVVALQGTGFAHVFMHELGHNLGLDHEPGTFVNHLSVMGQVPQTSADGVVPHEVLDYQRFTTPALDENALSETAGLGTPDAHPFFVQWYCPPGSNRTGGSPQAVFFNSWPADRDIDWNCSGDQFYPGLPGSQSGIDPGTVSADINGDGALTVIPAQSSEWAVLDYASGGQLGPRAK